MLGTMDSSHVGKAPKQEASYHIRLLLLLLSSRVVSLYLHSHIRTTYIRMKRKGMTLLSNGEHQNLLSLTLFTEPRQLTRYSDYTRGWMTEQSGFESLYGRYIYIFFVRSHLLWGPPDLLYNGYLGCPRGRKSVGT
jgi:hypothetical protein